jgi:hypothetical protein
MILANKNHKHSVHILSSHSGSPISPKTYAISRVPKISSALNAPVLNAHAIWGFYHKLLNPASVRHEWSNFSRFPKTILFNFCLIVFGGVLNSFDYSRHLNYIIYDIVYIQTPYRIEKLFKLWRHFERQRIFYLKQEVYVCLNISPKLFGEKLSAIPPFLLLKVNSSHNKGRFS